MTYRGHVVQGAVVLDEPAELADGTEVDVIVRDPAKGDEKKRPRRTLKARLAPFIGVAQDLPPDAAEHHDHDLYGTPRR